MSVKSAGTHVQVLYNYDYEDGDGNQISIREGEQFLLLKKANIEWWNVFRKGDKKPFYVPANYVEEIPKVGTPIQKKKETVEDSLDQYVSGDEEDIFQNGDNENGSKHVNANSDKQGKDAVADEPEYANLAVIQEAIHSKNLEKQNVDEGPAYANIEELKAHFRTTPPVPSNDDVPTKVMENGWEMYKDPVSERQFYYHSLTKETTWKPPRGMKPVKDTPHRSKSNEAEDDHRSRLVDPKQRYSMPVTPSVPPGWKEERTDTGDVCFVNDVSTEKWMSSVDENGRVYFYKEDGESSWMLPESPNQIREDNEDQENSEESVAPKPIPVRIKEHKGMLNKTRVMDNGKKIKKNWAPSFIATNGPVLYFYKDRKAAEPKSGQPKPEFCLELQGAHIDFGSKEVKSSKKNVIQVTSANGTQFLLQSDDTVTIHDWYITLKSNVAFLSEEASKARGSQGSLGSLDESSESVGSTHDRSTEEEPSSPSSTLFSRKRSNKKTGTLEKHAAIDDPSLTFPEKSSRIKDRLKNFFSKRPDLGTLQEKGIYKDAVFGAHMLQLCQREKTNVPRFVTQCMANIEQKGLDIDGIYRVSGNLAQIQKLRFMVDSSKPDEKYDLDQPDWDVHVLCGALKLFFRELKEPLVPFQSFNKFLDAIKKPDRSSKLRGFKEAMKTLPKPNRETLRDLFKHLNKVIEKSKENRMQTQNIAIVFGPTLMWPEVECHNVAVTMVYQNQIVEFCLLEYKNLF